MPRQPASTAGQSLESEFERSPHPPAASRRDSTRGGTHISLPQGLPAACTSCLARPWACESLSHMHLPDAIARAADFRRWWMDLHGRRLVRAACDAARVEDGNAMKITPWYLAALAPVAAM